jgi:hypothetical protein
MSIPGLVKTGFVEDFNLTNQTINIRSISAGSPNYSCNLDYVYADNNGVFIGAVPPSRNPALFLQGQGNQHHSLSYHPSNFAILPKLNPGELLLKNNDNNKIFFKDNTITLGMNEGDGLFLNNDYNSSNNNYNNQFNFSNFSRKINGIIKRETLPYESIDNPSIKLIGDDFYSQLPSINLFSDSDLFSENFVSSVDKVFTVKNPYFVEGREIVYEFSFEDDVLDLQNEAKRYDLNLGKVSAPINDRRKSRADTLSLSLHAPNYLMESVKGTVIDIYGNVLDLNRLPIKNNFKKNDKDSSVKNYYLARANQRRSLAYHFEINARKDLGETNSPPDVKNSNDYSRNRSRFFVDIDKEGQFKINVPASSEYGNIPLLTRYENYNTVISADNSEINPNELLFSDDKVDILHDSFAAGMVNFNTKYKTEKPNIDSRNGYDRGLITIKDTDGSEISPIDRFTKSLTDNTKQSYHIKHGTAFHDITATCISHQEELLVNYIYQKPVSWLNSFPYKAIDQSIVKTELQFGSNLGGRSGSINLDGSIEVNVGANTSDRQSIWLDTAGGMIANIGKDNNNISAAIGMDGQLLLQVGGVGIDSSKDSRFKKNNNAFCSGAVDIRVLVEGNSAAILRIDKEGIYLISPTRIYLESNGDIDITSSANININAESVKIQDRVFEKKITNLEGSS